MDEIIRNLARKAIGGKLLLFLGTGFSRAVLEYGVPKNKQQKSVPSWEELLKFTMKDFSVKGFHFPVTKRNKRFTQYDYPGVASEICRRVAIKNNSSLEQAVRDVKASIAERFQALIPSDKQREHIGDILSQISPVTVVTTNYDQILEKCLGDNGRRVEKGGIARMTHPGAIPIWHYHGSCHNPDSIVITREDYQPFLRPGNYPQTKLAILLRDYTVLFAGYSVSDMNVLTALDWADHVFPETSQTTDATRCASKDPSTGRCNRVILQHCKRHSRSKASLPPDSLSAQIVSKPNVIAFLQKLASEMKRLRNEEAEMPCKDEVLRHPDEHRINFEWMQWFHAAIAEDPFYQSRHLDRALRQLKSSMDDDIRKLQRSIGRKRESAWDAFQTMHNKARSLLSFLVEENAPMEIFTETLPVLESAARCVVDRARTPLQREMKRMLRNDLLNLSRPYASLLEKTLTYSHFPALRELLSER